MRTEVCCALNLYTHYTMQREGKGRVLPVYTAKTIRSMMTSYFNHRSAPSLANLSYLAMILNTADVPYKLGKKEAVPAINNIAIDLGNRLMLLYWRSKSSELGQWKVQSSNLTGYVQEQFIASNSTTSRVVFDFCDRNYDNIAYLKVLGWKVYTDFQRETSIVSIDKSKLDSRLFQYQVDGVQKLCSGYRLLADDMGCVSGDSKVVIKEQGKPATRKVTVTNLSRLFANDPTIKIKCLVNGRFAYMPIKGVLDKGIKETIDLRLEDTHLICTPDHLIYTKNGWVEAGKLRVTDEVYTNGNLVCKNCGATEDICTKPNGKFYGYCHKCMNLLKDGSKFKGDTIGRSLDKDGYVLLYGIKYRNHPCFNKWHRSVYEHHLVWYENTGHVVTKGEVIHHINGVKTDNRFENLQLMSSREHCLIHADTKTKHLPQFNDKIEVMYRNGTPIYMVPRLQKITNIGLTGEQHVWDIAIDSEDIHNFVCNSIVVHNCGKTSQALQFIQYKHIAPVLICCPATLKLNWKKEILMWTDATEDEITILSGTAQKTVTNRFVIANYDILPFWVETLSNGGFKLAVCDECHYIQSEKAQRTLAFLQIKKHIPDTLFMSGTPFTSHPIQLYTALHCIAPHIFRNMKEYGDKFCNPTYVMGKLQYKGASNVDLLHSILMDGICIRRRKEDVLDDLPDKLRVTAPVCTELPELRKDVATCNRIKELEQKIAHTDLMSSFEYQKQIAYLRKKHEVVKWIREFINCGRKLVVFAIHHEVIDDIMAEFGTIAVAVDGRTSIKKRDEAVTKFQNDPNIRLFIGNIKAAGVGLTLTAASDMLMTQFDWCAGTHIQAEDRIYRIGQKNKCTIYYLVCPHTIDEQIYKVINNKAKTMSGILDGREIKLFEEDNIKKSIVSSPYEYLFKDE